MNQAAIPVIDLGLMPYNSAFDEQKRHVEAVLASREAGSPEAGRLLLVEHPPVITVSRRAGARDHLLATPDLLVRHGVEVAETDRGGDITYHGPGQLVVYPILDLNILNLGLHAYMRLLEQAVIDACAALGIEGHRDAAATGVWTTHRGREAKICAMGVRVRKWVSMHGLALNLTTNLEHFNLIVPCGLVGRSVTSIDAITRDRGTACPSMADVKALVSGRLMRLISAARADAVAARAAHAFTSSPR